MPIIVHSSHGTVTGVSGKAQIRTPRGAFTTLQIGDQIHKGDVLLTTQDGIVEFTLAEEPQRQSVPAEEIPALIAAIDKGDASAAPAAGRVLDDETALTEPERVARLAEQVHVRYTSPGATAAAPAALEEHHFAPESLLPQEPARTAVVAVEEGPPVGLRLIAPAPADPVTTLTVTKVPSIGEVRSADGALVAVGAVLNPGDLPGLVYVPPDEYDGFTRVGDFSFAVATATTNVVHSVAIQVRAINDAPRATSDQGSTPEDTPVALNLQGQDVDGTIVAFTLLGIPSGGRLLLADGVTSVVAGRTISVAQAADLRFAPDADFNGAIEFSFSAIDDGGRSSPPALYSLAVTPVNDAPRAAADVATAQEDGSVTVHVLGNDADVEGDPIRITAVDDQPISPTSAIQLTHMRVVLNPDGTLTLTPERDFHGSVSFSYSVTDGALTGGANVTVHVTPANDAPATSAVTLAAIAEDSGARVITQAELLANASDVDGPALSATGLALNSRIGTLVNNGNGTWTYMPALDDDTSVSFSYSVSDGTASVASSATLDVTPVNDAPATSTVTLPTIAEDSGARLITQAELLANASDVDSANLRATSLAITGGNGALINNGNDSWSYTPASNDDTSVSFSYAVTDGSLNTAGSATLDITPVNDAPMTTPVTLTPIAEDSGARLITQGELLANANDVDGPSLIATGLTLSAGAGSLVDNGNGTWNYTPANNDDTTVSFTYSVTDGSFSVAGGASLDITPVNDAPVANPDSAITSLNQTLILSSATLLANDTDIDANDTLRISSVQAAANGTVSLDGRGNVHFSPTTGYFGPASFTYTVADIAGATAMATVDVAIGASGPILVAPGTLFGLTEGAASANTAAAILQGDLEATASLNPGILDTFDPPAGALSLPGLVDVFNGGLTSQTVSMRAGSVVAFDWEFFNGEFSLPDVQLGFNDMLIVAIADPAGTQQVIQLASSEQTGINVNGDAVDATSTFQFTAPAAGDYSFTWLVVNGFDFRRESSATIGSPRFIVGAGSFGTAVPFGVSAESADPNAAASLLITASGVPANAAFSAGTDLGSGVWSFTPAQLIGLEFLPPAGFVGALNLTIGASTVDPISGAVLTTSRQSTVTIDSTAASTMGTPGADSLVGTGANDHLQGFGGNDILNGAAGHDLLYGDSGNDQLAGGAGNDMLVGGDGSDILVGDDGNDRLRGGAGDDLLTGGADSDVFLWSLADRGLTGSPATDIVTDFAGVLPAAGGDVLDLRDLLIGEAKSGPNAGNLDQFLDFDTTTSVGSTIIRISTAGAFQAGNYASGAEDQRIVLQGIDLRDPAVFGLSAAAADNEIIQQLLQRGKLIADGP